MVTDPRTEIARLLCRQVRVLSVDQIAREYFCECLDSKTQALEAVRRLESLGYVSSRKISVRQLGLHQAPLFQWSPGQSEMPDFAKIAAANRKRWRGDLACTSVISATPKAHKRFGGTPRRVRLQEVEHDLRVADLWFSLSAVQQLDWKTEDSLAKNAFGNRRPDAVLEQGITKVIEVAGRSYSSTKLEAIFNHFNHLPLEFA
ncbi:hypothetical protein Poly59_40660 [Rubripirellula reticaptiva]|uniref:Uncharacterized protein n=1 Tax=Rubripirellula reticaptiva TaxID=2528013 RepID=A0A5C6EP87_9BACT|nr:hypothetical protein Poly59_40660 [Rubripirellula reticaptiva]